MMEQLNTVALTTPLQHLADLLICNGQLDAAKDAIYFINGITRALETLDQLLMLDYYYYSHKKCIYNQRMVLLNKVVIRREYKIIQSFCGVLVRGQVLAGVRTRVNYNRISNGCTQRRRSGYSPSSTRSPVVQEFIR